MEDRQFLDPLNENVSLLSFAAYNKALLQKVENYRKNPSVIKLLLVACLFFLIIWSGGWVLLKAYDPRILIIGFLPLFFYYSYIKKLENEVILYLLCERNNWAFNSVKSTYRAQGLMNLFPQVLDRGKQQEIYNQIWGSLGNNKKNGFWSGIFSYVLSSGRNSKRYEKTVFIIQMNKPLTCSFSLFRSGYRDSIKTESEEFNKLYRIRNHEKSGSSEEEIIKALSPSVQVRLIDFAKKFSLDCISFQDNCMTVLFNGKVWKVKHTNFFKSVTIDARDIKGYDDLVREMMELPSEMLKFLD